MELWSALKEDHRNIATTLKQMVGRYDLRHGLLHQLRDDVEAHWRGEEQAVYPAFRDVPGFGELIAQASERHAAILRLVHHLDSVPEQQWEARIAALQSLLHEYVEEEEDKIIDYGRHELPAHTVEHIKHKFIAAKKAVYEAAAKPI